MPNSSVNRSPQHHSEGYETFPYIIQHIIYIYNYIYIYIIKNYIITHIYVSKICQNPVVPGLFLCFLHLQSISEPNTCTIGPLRTYIQLYLSSGRNGSHSWENAWLRVASSVGLRPDWPANDRDRTFARSLGV